MRGSGRRPFSPAWMTSVMTISPLAFRAASPEGCGVVRSSVHRARAGYRLLSTHPVARSSSATRIVETIIHSVLPTTGKTPEHGSRGCSHSMTHLVADHLAPMQDAKASGPAPLGRDKRLKR